MTESTAFFVGLDIHKDWISAAVLEAVYRLRDRAVTDGSKNRADQACNDD